MEPEQDDVALVGLEETAPPVLTRRVSRSLAWRGDGRRYEGTRSPSAASGFSSPGEGPCSPVASHFTVAPGRTWKLWTENGCFNFQVEEHRDEVRARRAYADRRCARVLLRPDGAEVLSDTGMNRWALDRLRRHVAQVLKDEKAIDAGDAERIEVAVAVFSACDAVDEDRVLAQLDTLGPLLDEEFGDAQQEGDDCVHRVFHRPHVTQSPIGSALEAPLDAFLNSTRFEARDLIQNFAEIFQNDRCRPAGLNVQQMGRESVFDHPAYSISVATLGVVMQFLQRAEQHLVATVPKALQEIPMVKGGRFVVVGDTHGQLTDVLWMFFKYGPPSSHNVYLFNGDLVDRGGHGLEIVLLVMLLRLNDPTSVYVQRGNHEDDSMTSHYGFFNEIRHKYGFHRVQETRELYVACMRVFCMMPLATVVSDGEKKALVIHGGIPSVRDDHDMVTLEELRNINHHRLVPVKDWKDREDHIFFAALWSDPKHGPEDDPEGPGAWWPDTPGQRGSRGVAFGPKITAAFLEKNGLDVVVRAHELPDQRRGFQCWHPKANSHPGVVTVFSASNYCGQALNKGAVCIWTPQLFPKCVPSGKQATLYEHWAPDFAEIVALMTTYEHATQSVKEFIGTKTENEHLAKKAVAVSKVPASVENKVLSYVREMVVVRKAQLWKAFHEYDVKNDYYVTRLQWQKCCSEAIGYAFPWQDMLALLVSEGEMDPITGDIQYVKFLARYSVRFDKQQGMFAGWQDKILVRTFGHLLRQGLDLEHTLKAIDPEERGVINAAGIREALCKAAQVDVTEHQAAMIWRSVALAIGAGAKTEVSTYEFLSIFAAMFSSERRSHVSSTTFWVPHTLEWLGDQIMGQYATLVDFFRAANKSGSGFLAFSEFQAALSEIVAPQQLENEIRLTVKSAQSLQRRSSSSTGMVLPDVSRVPFEVRLKQLCEYVSLTDQHITLLEFMTAFAQHPGTEHLQRELLEDICITLHGNSVALRLALKKFDAGHTGKVTRTEFLDALKKLNGAIGRHSDTGPPLSEAQMEELVENLTWTQDEARDPVLEYERFISSFEFVDLCSDRQSAQLCRVVSAPLYDKFDSGVPS